MEITRTTAKYVLGEMFRTGKSATQIITEQNLEQITDIAVIEQLVDKVIAENPKAVAQYKGI